MLFKRKKERQQFMSWESYQQKMAMLELHSWQQATRRQSLANSLAQMEG